MRCPIIGQLLWAHHRGLLLLWLLIGIQLWFLIIGDPGCMIADLPLLVSFYKLSINISLRFSLNKIFICKKSFDLKSLNLTFLI